MARSEAVVVRPNEREWEGWAPDQRAAGGDVAWKTLISSDLTASDSITVGIARLRPGDSLRAHRHPQAEAYIVLAGELSLTAAGRRHTVEAGSCAWVPGGAIHECANEGAAEVRFAYVFAADSAAEIAYCFPRG